ncbi:hypothetical protein AVEN_5770-1 [Araneus ventricosus]|uniref:Uncharacterized protein n=1 Tax=Araneus ventricosus TaxID=182803 RepID=A0A4Y2DXH2_ARAVE|nr:hypothetical protein AVEN_5770-1 [Araneus ventricosus]
MDKRGQGYLKRVTPPFRSIRLKLNESRCNSSSTEAGVLVAIIGHCPTSRRRYVNTITGAGTHAPRSLLYPRPGTRNHLLIWRLLIHVLVMPPRGRNTET